MKTKLFVLGAIFSVSIAAQADEYSCKVYCESTSGPTTYITVNASSSSEAATIVDVQSDQICQDAGYSTSSSATMDASQCSRN